MAKKSEVKAWKSASYIRLKVKLKHGRKRIPVIAGGIIFGPFCGVIYTITSSTIGACIAFIVFSNSLLDLVRGKISTTLIIGIALVALVSLIPLFLQALSEEERH